jgi:hypothetical protein
MVLAIIINSLEHSQCRDCYKHLFDSHPISGLKWDPSDGLELKLPNHLIHVRSLHLLFSAV